MHKNTHTNDETLAAYNDNIDKYLANTPQEFNHEHSALLLWINTVISLTPQKGRVLEIGSGTGRDGEYMSQKGLDVTYSDGATGFVAYLKKQNKPVVLFNVLQDDFPEDYTTFFANAVMPHFDTSEATEVLTKAFQSLPPDGIFAFNVKQGQGDQWPVEKMNARRFIHFWDADEITELCESVGFEVVYRKKDLKGDLPSHTWTHLILRK